MANNRMFLVHPSGKKLLLAKYYPGSGWFIPGDGTTIVAKINDAFNEVDFGDDEWHEGKTPVHSSLFGDTAWSLQYESQDENDEISAAKRKIVEAVSRVGDK